MLITSFIYKLVYWWKISYFRLRGVSIGKGVKIYGKIIIKYPRNLRIGDYSTLNDGVLLNCKGGITIGKHCRISSNAQLLSTGLNIDEFPRTHKSESILLEDNVWLGSSSVVTMGVIIRNNSTIGALSLVNKDVETSSFYCGIPAKKIKTIQVKVNV